MTTPGDYFNTVAETLRAIPQEPVDRMVETLKRARAEGRLVFLFGNGGSAASASHITVDLLKGTAREGEPRLRALCLNDNMPTVTAYSNDVSYEAIFAEPLDALGRAGDVAFALSGSGNSPNVLRAMDAAAARGMTRLGLTGCGGGKLAGKCDACVVVPSDSMQVVEDAHLVILHSIFLQLMP